MDLKKTVFLDRDGTIIDHVDYLSEPSKVAIPEDVINGLGRLQKSGYMLVVITNQSGVNRGYFTMDDVRKVNDRMTALFENRGIKIDGIFCCPHVDADRCSCRKPQPGLIYEAAGKLNVDIRNSVMIGDKKRDVLAGVAAGCRLNILLGGEQGSLSRDNILSVDGMMEAADIILALDADIIEEIS